MQLGRGMGLRDRCHGKVSKHKQAAKSVLCIRYWHISEEHTNVKGHIPKARCLVSSGMLHHSPEAVPLSFANNTCPSCMLSCEPVFARLMHALHFAPSFRAIL